MSQDKPQIVCLPNGPCFFISDPAPKAVPYLQNSRNEHCSTVTGVSLCRCGGSENKPFCDGTHVKNSFTDTKMTDGHLDQRMSYEGKGVTIHDNRGICAHSGICTDNLASVFRLGHEPWIEPDGASVEEVIATIKQCPSGALSYTVDGEEHRDQERDPMITVTKNGPYAVCGGITLTGQPKGNGASDEHYTICRCGGSENKPFCDGTHWKTEFVDDQN